MGSVSYGRRVYGLRDLKITNMAGNIQEDLDAAQTLRFTPQFTNADLRGDDMLVETMTFVDGGTATVSAGGYSSAAIALMYGATVDIAGTSPTATATMKVDGGAVMPWFKVYGLSRGPDGDDVHVYLGKCKITGGGEMLFQDGQYFITSLELRVIDDGTNGVWKIVQHETATALPTS